MFLHIYGIAHTKGFRTVNKDTGEVAPYDKLQVYALEPLTAREWKLQDGSSGSREGFGQIPIKDLSCPFERFTMVFGIYEYNELMQFVDKDCEVSFDRYGRLDTVKLRT